MKKIISLISAICFALTSFTITTSAAANAQGYAIYRDGDGINPDWHSGYICSVLYNGNQTVLHVDNGNNGNSNHVINYASLSGFINELQFYGYYIPNKFATTSAQTANTIRDNVIETARQLQEKTKDEDGLRYSLTHQVWYTDDSNNNGQVDVEEIEGMRCDGLIEYCYELNNAPIYGDNISTFDTSIRDDHSLTKITPKKQSTLYMQNCLGDINYDYQVTAADARIALQYSSKTLTDYDTYQFFVADVNGDNALTAVDSRLILQYSSAVIDIFPADPLAE